MEYVFITVAIAGLAAVAAYKLGHKAGFKEGEYEINLLERELRRLTDRDARGRFVK